MTVNMFFDLWSSRDSDLRSRGWHFHRRPDSDRLCHCHYDHHGKEDGQILVSSVVGSKAVLVVVVVVVLIMPCGSHLMRGCKSVW